MIDFGNFYQLIAKIICPIGWKHFRRKSLRQRDQHGLLNNGQTPSSFCPS